MVTIIFTTADEAVHPIEAQPGQSVMEIAVKSGLPGIDGDCGGACACATCHVQVGSGWVERLTERSDMEASMLEFASGVDTNSRLACQIIVRPELDGLRIQLPREQH